MKTKLTWLLLCLVLFTSQQITFAKDINDTSDIIPKVKELYMMEDPVQRLRDIRSIMYWIDDLKLRIWYMRNVVSYWLKIKNWEIRASQIWSENADISEEEFEQEDIAEKDSEEEAVEEKPKEEIKKPTVLQTYKFWPYDKSISHDISEEWEYLYSYKLDWLWYLNINGTKDISIYDDESVITNWFNYMAKSKKEWKWYVNINWKETGPFTAVLLEWSRISSNWSYILVYKEDEKYMINVDWEISGPFVYINLDSIQLTKNWKYWFSFWHFTDGSEWFLNINWEEYWPYWSIDFDISDNWKSIFSYLKIAKDFTGTWERYVNLNWKESWPYSSAEIIDMSDMWDYIYRYQDRW